jgi:hypothetical protein
MAEIADRMTVAAAPATVWAAIQSPSTHASWHPFASEIKGVHALGEVRRCSVDLRGKPGATRETCTTYDAERAIGWRIEEDSSGFSRMVAEWTSGFRLDADGDATLVTAWSDFRPRWFVRPMLPMIRRRFHHAQREILDGLRGYVERA